MEEKIDLSELGLSRNESKVYSALIQFGKLGAGELSSKSGVSYGRIYDVLGVLINKNLVYIIPEKTKKFIPASPENFLKLIDDKQRDLEKIRQRIKEMRNFYNLAEKNPVQMQLGRKGFYKIVKDMKTPKKYDYTIRWTSEPKPDSIRKFKESKKEGVDLRFLTRYDSETERNVKEWFKINKNIRKFNNEGVAIGVQDDEEVLLGLIKSNVTLLIRNKPFAKVMKQLFLETYKNAEEIK
jgi:sugar-specific transcriptional regulator TrmB